MIAGVYQPEPGDVATPGQSLPASPTTSSHGWASPARSRASACSEHVRARERDGRTYGDTKALRGSRSSGCPGPGARSARSALAEDVLSFFGERLAGYRWDQPAYSLSYANRRRLEIARALATRPRLLLLDEPAAGMNPAETHEITELIGRLREERGVAILVIEHDMHVVAGVSDRVIALDHGVKIAEGSFNQVANHPAVVEAYLGRDPEALAEGA